MADNMGNALIRVLDYEAHRGVQAVLDTLTDMKVFYYEPSRDVFRIELRMQTPDQEHAKIMIVQEISRSELEFLINRRLRGER